MSVRSSMTRVLLAGLSVFQLLVLVQCTCIPREYREFNSLPRERKHAEFRMFSIEKQYDVHMYYMRRWPPRVEFEKDIAMRGWEVVPFLRDKLEQARSDRDQVFIISIFTKMSINRHADLREDRELIVLLEDVVASMHPAWSRHGEHDLWYIKEKPNWEDDIAARGEKALPSLKKRLQELAEDEVLRLDALKLFVSMNTNHHVNVRDDPELMAFLEDVVASMSDYPINFRGLGESQLQRIREGDENE